MISEFIQSTDIRPGRAIAMFVVPGTKDLVIVKGKRKLFVNFEKRDLIELNGYNLQDSAGVEYFEAVGCSKIYSEKIQDVLGE